MDLELNSKRAIVTGGRQGIGRAIAAALAAEGARVVIASRDAEGLTLTAKELRELTGGHVEAHVVDTGSAESVAALVDDTVAAWGGCRHPGEQRSDDHQWADQHPGFITRIGSGGLR